MASPLKSVSNAISATFDAVGEVGHMAHSAVAVGTEYVDNRATKFRVADQERVSLELAEELQEIQDKLEADEKLDSMYEHVQQFWPRKQGSSLPNKLRE